MNIAVAFSGYDSVKERILDPSIGELSFSTYSWGNDENGNPFNGGGVLKSHPCTRDELNLEDNSVDPKFNKAHESSWGNLNYFW
mmetsp:Transcript_14907/g.20202  ORF Transcript_14907/g.20202 Transcript_14907/m.20202 type:complete len:84 (+) Transcript_14907:360-611(+)